MPVDQFATRRRLVFGVALAMLVVARSIVFVFWPAAHFDSDQAVTGLMATHLAELRAFPVFWYGQTYMLGVEAWLAAPVMAIFGASVTALKLPLLAMNLAIALLLFRGLTRDEGLDEGRAAFATLFFVLAAPITSAHLLTANGGNVEPSLYVLLLWTLRRRPIWFGLVLGVGFLNREFTIYGAAALVVLDLARRTPTRAERGVGVPASERVGGSGGAKPPGEKTLRRYALAFGTAALVWLAFLALRHFSSAAGPGTSTADLSATLAGNNLLQVAARLCFDLRAIAAGAGRVLTVHWPELFGLEPQPLTDFGIESTVRQGLTASAWLLVPVVGIPLVRQAPRASHIARLRAGHTDRASAGQAPYASGFCAYLMLVATFSLAGYLIGRCGVIDFYTMRYELLSLLGAVGLAGWYLRVERSRGITAVWALCCAAILVISITAHVRLLGEYVTHPPVALKQDLIRELDARHIRYAYADFWTSYYVSFMTRERIIVASDEAVKVRTYNRLVDAHRDEAIRISRRPCADGYRLTAAFWGCTP
jgi:hypothetical protein